MKGFEEINVLRKEIEELKVKIKATENEIKQKDKEINLLEKSKDGHIKNLENILNKSREREIKKDQTIKELEIKVNDMVKERDDFYTTIGERDMLYLDFKERIEIKYGYESGDDESEYESDENVNETLEKTKKCELFDFIGKTISGLKTHITKKHRDK